MRAGKEQEEAWKNALHELMAKGRITGLFFNDVECMAIRGAILSEE